MNTHINHAMIQDVCAFLGWTVEQYTTMQYNSGLYYLVLFFNEEKKAVDLMERSRGFWKWWIIRWQERDMHYMQRAGRVPAHAYSAQSRVQDYYAEHDATILTHTIAVPRCIGYKVQMKEVVYGG